MRIVTLVDGIMAGSSDGREIGRGPRFVYPYEQGPEESEYLQSSYGRPPCIPNGPRSGGGLLPPFWALGARGAAAKPPKPPLPPAILPPAPWPGLPPLAAFGSAAGITRGSPKPDNTPAGITNGVIVGSESLVAVLCATTVLEDGDCAATHIGSRKSVRN